MQKFIELFDKNFNEFLYLNDSQKMTSILMIALSVESYFPGIT